MAICANKLKKGLGSPWIYNNLTYDLYWRTHVSHDMGALLLTEQLRICNAL